MTEETRSGPSRNALARAILAAAVLPLVAGAVGVALVLSWRDELPARVATHWNGGGTVDGFGSVSGVGWLIGGFAAGFAVVGLVLVLAVRGDAMVTRVTAGFTAGTTAFIATLGTTLTESQRGLADPATAPLPAVAILSALAIGVAVALLAVMLVPLWPSERGDVPADAPRLAVGAGERVVWTRSVGTGSLPAVILVAGVGVTAAAGAIMRQWWMLALSLVLALVVVAMFSITVTVDRRGLTVRGRFGWPRMNTPLDQVVRASVVTVRPIRDFGGYGYRISVFGPLKGTGGFVLRGGEALLVERASGLRTLVVVDDAGTAAGLLNTLVEQHSSR